MGMGFASTWLCQVSPPPLLPKTTLTTGDDEMTVGELCAVASSEQTAEDSSTTRHMQTNVLQTTLYGSFDTTSPTWYNVNRVSSSANHHRPPVAASELTPTSYDRSLLNTTSQQSHVNWSGSHSVVAQASVSNSYGRVWFRLQFWSKCFHIIYYAFVYPHMQILIILIWTN